MVGDENVSMRMRFGGAGLMATPARSRLRCATESRMSARLSVASEGNLVTDAAPATPAAGGDKHNGNHDDEDNSTGDENSLHD